MLAALFLWSLTRGADAQGVCACPVRAEFCREPGLHGYPERAPWHLERSRFVSPASCWCECCDVTYTHSWQGTIPLGACDKLPGDAAADIHPGKHADTGADMDHHPNRTRAAKHADIHVDQFGVDYTTAYLLARANGAGDADPRHRHA